MKRFLKIASLVIGLAIISLIVAFFIRPSLFVDFYIKEGDIFIETKPIDFPIRLTYTGDISTRSNYHIHWSPSRSYVAYSERVLGLEDSPEYYDNYWAIILLNPRTMKTRTIAITDLHLFSHAWLDDETIRIFKRFGTGSGGYTDVKINKKELVITSNSSFDENWEFIVLGDMYEMIEKLNESNYY